MRDQCRFVQVCGKTRELSCPLAPISPSYNASQTVQGLIELLGCKAFSNLKQVSVFRATEGHLFTNRTVCFPPELCFKLPGTQVVRIELLLVIVPVPTSQRITYANGSPRGPGADQVYLLLVLVLVPRKRSSLHSPVRCPPGYFFSFLRNKKGDETRI